MIEYKEAEIIALTETKNPEIVQKLKKHRNVISNVPDPRRGGSTVIYKYSVLEIESSTYIDDCVITVFETNGAILILASVYLSSSTLNTKQRKTRLALVLDRVDLHADKYEKPSIIITGDLNLLLEDLVKVFNNNSAIIHKYGLAISNNYQSPLGNQNTRRGTNKNGDIIDSRLD